MKAPAASEMRQQSSMLSGSAICFEPITSSTVSGFFMCALGCSEACSRVVTATCASCSRVVPYSCMWRCAIIA